jgi:hypothetical protein
MIRSTINSPIGQLSVDEIYAYYDGPRLFTAKNKGGQSFLVVHADETDAGDTWLLAPISTARSQRIREGGIDLHDAFANSETGGVWQAYEGGPQRAPEWLESARIPADLLPDKGERLASR